MKYIEPMTCKEFADYLLTLKDGDEINFGCDPGCEWPDEVPEPNDVTAWYFARVMHIEGYSSRFILLDYCGGEEAFAIPLNNYKNERDMDDESIVHRYVRDYFAGYNCYLTGINDIVFVEMEEE